MTCKIMTKMKIYDRVSYYDVDGPWVVFGTYEVKVGKHEEYEIVVRSNETSPSRNMLHKYKSTSIARINISVRNVLTLVS